MNGARSTYMRKGYLFTALAAAVLLAASSGTAYAQTPSVGFVTLSGSVAEEATERPNTPALLKVKVRATGLPAGAATGTTTGGEGNTDNRTPRQKALDALGTITVRLSDIADTLIAGNNYTAGNRAFDFAEENEITLTISPPTTQDDNWNDETFTMQLQSNLNINTGSVYTGMVIDDDVAPVAKFTKDSIRLTEDSNTDVSIQVVTGKKNTAIPGAMDSTNFGAPLEFTALPADAVGIACPTTAAPGTNALMIGGAVSSTDDDKGEWETTANISALTTAAEVTITACDDMSNYRGTTVTLTIDPMSLASDAAGDITAGPALSIMIESDEEIPTVSFSPTDVVVDEGGSVETVLISEGALGSAVGMVTLSVKAGDALVGLYQGMDKLEANADGNIVVDLGTSNSARLTAKSYSDPDLNDGDTNFIAWEITDADGANIGDGYWFRVDVMGSTAVPALPLLGQLLLALFLMAGGARLYRRRQG